MVSSRADATRDKPKAKPKAAKPKATKATGPIVRKKKLHLRTRELVRFRCQNLELDLMNLRQEISTLERTRQLLYARTLNRPDDFGGSLFKTIQQFYKLMRGGYHDLVWLHGASERPLDFNQFIRVTFAEALAIGPEGAPVQPHGRDQFVQILTYMTSLTGTPNVQVLEVQIQRSSDNCTATVLVQTLCTSPLSVNMLEHKYAHIRQYPELRQKLVGRVISAYGEARYVFDLRTGRIVQANIQADHAGAILQVVDTQDEYEFLVGGHHNESRFAEVVDDCTDSAASPSSRGSSPSSVASSPSRVASSPSSVASSPPRVASSPSSVASSPISVSSSPAAIQKVLHVEPRTTSSTMSLSFVLTTDESANE